MKLSRMMGHAHATAVEVNDLQQLSKLATNASYCLSTFKGGTRNVENFESTEAIGLDFDSGMTLAQAKEAFASYKHLILPTKSHQKEKNGVTCDRFRVILFLTSPITDAETYYATWHTLQAKFPAIDPACKDPSRQFYKSISVDSIRNDGALVEPVKPQPKAKLEVVQPLSPGLHGDLGKRTLKFLALGAPQGQKHHELYAAARDAYQQGYTKEWFETQVQKLAQTTGDKAYVDSGSIKTIADAFTKEPKHAPRIEEQAFSFMPIGELFARKVEIEWHVAYLLAKGGMSIFAGPPKSGKSTLVRQLCAAICRGTDFLTHKVKTGEIVYLAMEEQEAMLKSDFKRLGITDKDPITIHVGGVHSDKAIAQLEQFLMEKRPVLVVVDTLFLLTRVKNINDYTEVNGALAKIREMARKAETHILCVHHSKKPMEGSRGGGGSQMLGSSAIFGAVDLSLMIEVHGRERTITTQGRGVKQYSQRPIIFDVATHTYTLGPMPEEEF